VPNGADTTSERTDRQPSYGARWLSWLFGGALLAAVIWGALHFSEERAFVRLAERAEPLWLAVALLLQQAYSPRRDLAARGRCGRLSAVSDGAFSLAKLFADQALPSAGMSNALIAKALEQRGLPSRRSASVSSTSLL
jgi:Mg2+-importing ATPase